MLASSCFRLVISFWCSSVRSLSCSSSRSYLAEGGGVTPAPAPAAPRLSQDRSHSLSARTQPTSGAQPQPKSNSDDHGSPVYTHEPPSAPTGSSRQLHEVRASAPSMSQVRRLSTERVRMCPALRCSPGYRAQYRHDPGHRVRWGCLAFGQGSPSIVQTSFIYRNEKKVLRTRAPRIPRSKCQRPHEGRRDRGLHVSHVDRARHISSPALHAWPRVTLTDRPSGDSSSSSLTDKETGRGGGKDLAQGE